MLSKMATDNIENPFIFESGANIFFVSKRKLQKAKICDCVYLKEAYGQGPWKKFRVSR